MKHLKAKLMATVMSLTLSMLMLTSASFAWFTISTAPEISTLNTTVVTNENLEICLANSLNVPGAAAVGDSGNAYTWGNLVDLTSGTAQSNYNAFKTANNGDSTKLRPIGLGTVDSTNKTYTAGAAGSTASFYYPSYGTDGRVTQLTALSTESNFQVGTGSDKTDSGFGTLEAGGKPYAYYVDFWLRSNVSGQVSLAAKDTRRGDSNSAKGSGSVFTAGGSDAANQTLASNVRIAFRVLKTEGDNTNTTSTAGTATPVTATTASGANTTTYTGNVVSLTANQAKLVRMFVYLEGQNVTNAAASTDAATIAGNLTVQFQMAASGSNDGISASEAMQVNAG